LPSFKVPTVIFVLESDLLLPKTSTGKIQRMAVLAKLSAAGVQPVLHASLVEDICNYRALELGHSLSKKLLIFLMYYACSWMPE